MKEITLGGQRVALYALDTVVVGSGCAGFNAADTLFDLGRRDIALLTEGVNMGTSRNTGSDKQTYYKLSLCADAQDWRKTSLPGAASTGTRLWRRRQARCAPL